MQEETELIKCLFLLALFIYFFLIWMLFLKDPVSYSDSNTNHITISYLKKKKKTNFKLINFTRL